MACGVARFGAGEQLVPASLGEPFRTDQSDPTDPIQRVVAPAPMAEHSLVHPPSHLVERRVRQADGVEVVHDHHRVGQAGGQPVRVSPGTRPTWRSRSRPSTPATGSRATQPAPWRNGPRSRRRADPGRCRPPRSRTRRAGAAPRDGTSSRRRRPTPRPPCGQDSVANRSRSAVTDLNSAHNDTHSARSSFNSPRWDRRPGPRATRNSRRSRHGSSRSADSARTLQQPPPRKLHACHASMVDPSPPSANSIGCGSCRGTSCGCG